MITFATTVWKPRALVLTRPEATPSPDPACIASLAHTSPNDAPPPAPHTPYLFPGNSGISQKGTAGGPNPNRQPPPPTCSLGIYSLHKQFLSALREFMAPVVHGFSLVVDWHRYSKSRNPNPKPETLYVKPRR